MLTVHQIINSPVSSNCFIVYDKAIVDECIVIDPGSESDDVLLDYIKQNRLKPKYIILTHEHFDHCWGVNELREHFPTAELVCSMICSEAIQDKKKNYSVFHQQPGFALKPADIILDDVNWSISWNDYELRFLPAQGHSASGILLFFDKYIFTGDTLIKDIKTVTKLKTGSKEKLLESVILLEQEKGKNLFICPGHGEMFELDNYNLNNMINDKDV